jgi:hypothetical protein
MFNWPETRVNPRGDDTGQQVWNAVAAKALKLLAEGA